MMFMNTSFNHPIPLSPSCFHISPYRQKLVLPTHHHSLGNDLMLMLVKINEHGNFHIIDYGDNEELNYSCVCVWSPC